MKRNVVIVVMLLLVSAAVSACAPAAPDDQMPEFFNDIGKTFNELKKENPEGEFIVSSKGLPGAAAACFGEEGEEYSHFFFGGQSGDFEKALNDCGEEIKCAGFISTAGVVFSDMEDDMSFDDFFALIGVDDYEYLLGEEVVSGEGWLRFIYHDMEVMINTNEVLSGGGWNFTGEEIVKRNAPLTIVDPEILKTNQDIADAVMFG